jgi:hypothetical protein
MCAGVLKQLVVRAPSGIAQRRTAAAPARTTRREAGPRGTRAAKAALVFLALTAGAGTVVSTGTSVESAAGVEDDAGVATVSGALRMVAVEL